ncbi:MAG: hypothetical protein IIX41_03770 [Bacteroidales bacterium]|nr:hypothetical protein [Bacteroidales bacterium]
MVHLDSDLLGILLALLTFVVPVITSFKEAKKKKARQQQEIVPDEHIAEESDDLEEMFNVLLGKQKEELEQDPDDAWVQEVAEVVQEPEVAEVVETQRPAAAELEKNEPFTEGTSAVAQAYQPSVEPVAEMGPEAEGKAVPSIKDKFRNNPKDAVIMGEILKPKFKEY